VLPHLGEYGDYDVVNLINPDKGKNAVFKNNFVKYVQNKEKDLRTYDRKGFA